MKAFLKYPGGKQREVDIIKMNLPQKVKNYYEPFIGGGSVYLALNFNENYYINDISKDLIKVYEYTKNQDKKFFGELEKINGNLKMLREYLRKSEDIIYKLYKDYKNKKINYDYSLNELLTTLKIERLNEFKEILTSSLKRKLKLIEKLENKKPNIEKEEILKNIKTGFNSGLYTYYRMIYNSLKNNNEDLEQRIALFYYIRDFCYSSMFRYNSSGEFNVPYGGISYDNKDLDLKIKFLKNKNLIKKLQETRISNEDFEIFFKNNKLKNEDFIFLDPPYDTEFSTYDNNPFELKDQIRLRDFCKGTKANFMLIIKKTDFILELYKDFNVREFEKNYTVSFKNRNKKNVEHLLITNY